MIEGFAFVLTHYGENSQLICSADHLCGFYLVRVIERNFNLRLFMSLFDRIFIVTIFFVLNLLFYFWSVVCSVILFQRGTVGVFSNRILLNRLQYKNMFEPTCFQMHFFIEYCYLPCNIMVSLLMLLAESIYLKPKVRNVATISVLALFFLHGFTYGQSIGCIVLSWY